MKTISTLLITSLLVLTSVRKTEAAVGAAAALFGGGTQLALAGLSTYGGSLALGYICYDVLRKDCEATGLFMAMFGLIILDEEQISLEFSKISLDKSSDLGVSEDVIAIYNSEIEEVNLVFGEVKEVISTYSTIEESKEIWKEYGQYLSEESFLVMKAISNYGFKKFE